MDLKLSRQQQRARSSAVRNALAPDFGKGRVSARCGSESNRMGHWLYIGIRLRRGDERNKHSHRTLRAEVIRILKEANITLYTGTFPSEADSLAVSIAVTRDRG